MMAVYVDHARNRYGRMKMSHMIADSVDELLEMADRIGLDRRHFQPGSHPHFDVSEGYRKRAIQAGTRPVDRHCLVALMRKYRQRLSEDPAEREALARASAFCDRGHSR